MFLNVSNLKLPISTDKSEKYYNLNHAVYIQLLDPDYKVKLPTEKDSDYFAKKVNLHCISLLRNAKYSNFAKCNSQSMGIYLFTLTNEYLNFAKRHCSSVTRGYKYYTCMYIYSFHSLRIYHDKRSKHV